MIKTGIFGISGYAGQKLTEILVQHPEVEIAFGVVAPEEGNPEISEIIPSLKDIINFKCDNHPDWKKVEETDLIFLALPHSVSMKFIPEILKRGKKTIDLSADFRFKNLDTYEKWYKTHDCPEFLKDTVYGLPEINRGKIKEAKFIANPGCYPTSVILATLPLVKNSLIENKIIANSVSGVTGAGRKPSLSNLFPECNENIKAYKIGEHRHCPEMEEVLKNSGENNYNILFVPHLAPYNQGILSTCYVDLKENSCALNLQQLYEDFYGNEPFVRIMKYGISPETKNVVNTNFCDIGIKLAGENKLVVISAIDNLVKGASGQAVQNMNIMFGFEETIPFYKKLK